MKHLSLRVALSLGLFGSAQAMEQLVDLVPGWNAVHLEVAPEIESPDQLFGAHPIEQVALWIPSKAKVGSLTDPAALPSKPSSWLVWHPEQHPAAFLNTLKRVQGRRAMLIKASQATVLTIAGTPLYERQTWIAPSFNLVGFDIDTSRKPTFARFFDGSRAHEDLKIYQLVGGEWTKVAPSQTMRRGEAYWVWCKEGSGFQGPLDVTVSLADSLRFEATAYGQLPVHLSSNVAGLAGLNLEPGRRQRWTRPLPDDLTQFSVYGGGMRLDFTLTQAGD